MAMWYCFSHLLVNNHNFMLQFASIPSRHRRHLCYFKGKCSWNHYFTMHLTPNRYKIVILKANAQEIVTFKCVWHQICTKLLLSRQILRKSLPENACNTKYVQNYDLKGTCKENCYLNMCVTPNMYKIITVKTNAKEIITEKCLWSNQSSWKNEPCAKCFNTHLWGFWGDTWENIHFES